MAPLTSLPLEIILQVYEESETFTDAVSLSSCCIRLRLIWKENQDVLAFKIALKTIPAFDNALITIRATAAAKSNLVNYILNEETPAEPVLIPPSFSYHVSKPKFPETLSVLSLFTLIDCALYLAQYGHPDHLRKLGCKLENETWRQGVPYVILPNDKESSYAHRYVVFSGMYRVFLAGAILSWAHIYPIVKEDSPVRERFLPDPIRPRFNIAANATSEMPHISPNIELNQAEITYLKKFLPFQLYNLGNSNSPNPIRVDDFRPLAEYLIQKGREDFELDDLGPPGYKETFVEITVEDHKQGSVIQQFLMLQNAYEILRRVIADKFLPKFRETG
ncbi:uncharacterized protein DFL_003389 [Arthrobotrys flagrans]|uniref:Uncharacterized protein n=1 Tax=Arthrobotrys flagrans TaxID=97331 RepID=A0A437A1Q3_ARTFL|nr:hypothetical protein DFL_003389 [Arthrobotrys flagrans]